MISGTNGIPQKRNNFSQASSIRSLPTRLKVAYVSGTVYEPENFGNATDYGAELSFTRYFGRIGITGNYTYLYSSSLPLNPIITWRPATSTPIPCKRGPCRGRQTIRLIFLLLYRDTRKSLLCRAGLPVYRQLDLRRVSDLWI